MRLVNRFKAETAKRYLYPTIALIVAATNVASNTGFKISYALLGSDGGINSLNGTNTISLPYKRKPGITMASDLMCDIGKSNCFSIQRFLRATNTLQSYTGLRGSAPDFPLTAGEGYFLRVGNSTNYVIDGSHDGTLSVLLLASDGGVTSLNGTNLYSHPYNATATTAKSLMDDIGATSVAYVSRFLRATNTLQTYTGSRGSGPDFPLVPGEAYYVRVLTAVNYVPSHY